MRTSSMRPLNHSDQTLLPPIRSGAVEALIDPACARVPTWTPFTYVRIAAPSYVTARCAQVPAASPDDPTAARSVPPLTAPLSPLPDPSPTADPPPSSNPYAATKPGRAVLLTVTVTALEVLVLPAASRARAVRVCEPFVAAAVFQAIENGEAVSSEPS